MKTIPPFIYDKFTYFYPTAVVGFFLQKKTTISNYTVVYSYKLYIIMSIGTTYATLSYIK
jgi:hypothetical protein